MIIVFSRGQMSNHLFQYMYLVKQAKEGERVIVIGMTELFRVFGALPHQDNVFHLSTTDKRWLRAVSRFVIDKSLSFFARKGLISSYQPKIDKIKGIFESESGAVVYKKGFFSCVSYARGNFQSPLLYNENDVDGIAVKEKHVQQAKEFLAPLAKKTSVCAHTPR